MGNSNGGSGGMVVVLLLGGVCCLSLLCVGGVVLLYNTNQDFKASIDGMFNTGGGGQKSPMSGKWVCPDAPQGYDPFGDPKADGDVYWCQHPKSNDDKAPAIVKNHHRASLLPDPAEAGKTYTYLTIEEKPEGGEAGVFGPALGGFGSKDSDISKTAFKYTAPMPDDD